MQATPKKGSHRSIEPVSERFTYYAVNAALSSLLVLAVAIGTGILTGLFTSRSSAENGLLFQKLAAAAGGSAVLGCMGAALILGALLLRNLMLRIRQARFDRMAKRVLQVLRADPAAGVPDFVVYLRAFETTRHLGVPLYLRLQKLYSLASLTVNDVENHVSNAVGQLGPLVALGRPGEAFGAGRVITAEEEWKQDILLLLHRCRAILLVPSHRKGTLWEIESIYHEGLLEKCIFVMPPRSKKAIDTSERWGEAKAAIAMLGLEVPDYQSSGMLFTLNASGKISAVEPLILGRMRPLRKAIRRLLKPRKAVALFEAVAKADRRGRRGRAMGWAFALYSLLPLMLAAANFFLPPLSRPQTEESWGLTFDRIGSYKRMSDYDIEESVLLYKSDKYRAWTATISSQQADSARSDLIIKGLFRLDDDLLRGYYIALADMLDRTDPGTCAGFTSDKGISRPAADVFSYIPPEEIHDFLRARTEALLAEVEDRPLPVIDSEAVGAASARFMDLFTADERARWERLNDTSGETSGADTCWLARKMYEGVKKLPARDSANWARGITATVIQSRERGQAPAALLTEPTDHQRLQKTKASSKSGASSMQSWCPDRNGITTGALSG